jgi:hypothetical protein
LLVRVRPGAVLYCSTTACSSCGAWTWGWVAGASSFGGGPVCRPCAHNVCLTCRPIRAHTHTHIHTYTHSHTYTHTHIHTHTPPLPLSSSGPHTVCCARCLQCTRGDAICGAVSAFRCSHAESVGRSGSSGNPRYRCHPCASTPPHCCLAAVVLPVGWDLGRRLGSAARLILTLGWMTQCCACCCRSSRAHPALHCIRESPPCASSSVLVISPRILHGHHCLS